MNVHESEDLHEETATTFGELSGEEIAVRIRAVLLLAMDMGSLLDWADGSRWRNPTYGLADTWTDNQHY